MLAFVYVIDTLVDLILSDLALHVVEGEHGTDVKVMAISPPLMFS